jgi:hypothetical protein
MELLEDEQVQVMEGQELSKETVTAIQVAREIDSKLIGKPKNRRSKEKNWGPVLVERNRRRQNDGTSMMQTAMELKKRKNLEPMKGNPFSALMTGNFEKLTKDMNLHVNMGKSLVDREKLAFDKFVDDHPEVILPVSLDVLDDNVVEIVGSKTEVLNEMGSTPVYSLKDADSSTPWTEVVRRGRNRSG